MDAAQRYSRGRRFCSKCGKQIVGTIAPRSRSRDECSGTCICSAILWLAFSAFNTLGGLVLLVLGNVLFPHLHEMKDVPPDVPTGFLTALFSTLGIHCAGESGVWISRGMGIAAARTLGAHAGADPGVHLAVYQYSAWHRDRRLHDVGAAAGQSQQEYEATGGARAA